MFVPVLRLTGVADPPERTSWRDRRATVARLLVALQQLPIDRARSAAPIPNPLFRWRRAYVTCLTFFPAATGLPCGRLACKVRPDVHGKLEPTSWTLKAQAMR